MDSERSERDPSASAEVAAALWGEQIPPPASEARQDSAPAIWGSVPEAPPADPDPSRQWMDLWGDQAPIRSPESARERPQPPRYTLPEVWTAAPKPRPPWRLRFRRR
jgi:hypothetical protein